MKRRAVAILADIGRASLVALRQRSEAPPGDTAQCNLLSCSMSRFPLQAEARMICARFFFRTGNALPDCTPVPCRFYFLGPC